jgi:hypothetical protein
VSDDAKNDGRENRSRTSGRKPNVVQAKATVMSKTARPIVANAQTAPRLGNFTEPEDTSLRLSDLVADIDTKD